MEDIINSNNIAKNVKKINPNINPKFIVLGHQKSGTSAIATLLAERGDLTKQIDIPGLGVCVQGLVSLRNFIEEHSKYFLKSLIKEPGLTFIYREIVDCFPNAKYIFVIRHPLDNIRSILDRVHITPDKLPMSFDIIEKMNIHEAWKKKLLGKALIYNEGSNLPETLAFRWRKAAKIYLDNSKDIFLVKYENFVVNKEKVINDLSRKLDIPQQKSIKNKLNIQYQPKGMNRDKSILALFSKEVIKNVENYCSFEMKQLNYDFYSI